MFHEHPLELSGNNIITQITHFDSESDSSTRVTLDNHLHVSSVFCIITIMSQDKKKKEEPNVMRDEREQIDDQ